MIEKLPSNSPWLKWIPSFKNKEWNKLDSFKEYNDYVQSLQPNIPLYHGPIDFTLENQYKLRDILLDNNNIRTIVEIGVCRDNYNSSTQVILNNKHPDAQYIGIDIRDLSFLEDETNKIKIIQGDSKNKSILSTLQWFNQIDLLLIDGDHSIDYVLNDFDYTRFLSKNGFVIMHDINHHPGPREVFEAVNEAYFKKIKTGKFDYGLGILEKI